MSIERGCDVTGWWPSPLCRIRTLRRRGAMVMLAAIFVCLCIIMTDVAKPSLRGLLFDVALTRPTNERTSLVYIKTHKTASETLSAVFRRFGLVRNLSFVLPVRYRNNLGWPAKLDRGMYRQSKVAALKPEYYNIGKVRQDGHYDILCEHTLFTEDAMVALMPRGTLFVTSIREPFQRFRSAFEYFNVSYLLGLGGIDSSNDIDDFLGQPDHYDRLLRALPSNGSRACLPKGFSFLRNGMAFDLGFRQGYPNGSEDWSEDKAATDRWLRRLERRFDLVMLVEYFDESLVLLRRLMNWHWKDILYASRNPTSWSSTSLTATNTSPNRTLDYSLIERRFRRWSGADYALYGKFRSILKQKIYEGGEDFQEELRYFRFVQDRTATFCGKALKGDVLVFASSALLWGEKKDVEDHLYKEFNVTSKDCYLIRNRLMHEIRREYDRKPVKVTARIVTGQNC